MVFKGDAGKTCCIFQIVGKKPMMSLFAATGQLGKEPKGGLP
jgi:hypothetical protein